MQSFELGFNHNSHTENKYSLPGDLLTHASRIIIDFSVPGVQLVNCTVA
jgi:hypothetical protein